MPKRWDALFADLAAELDAEAEAEQRSEVADRVRAGLGRLRLVDRLRPALDAGTGLRVAICGHEPVTGCLQGLGSDWLLLAEDTGDERLVPLSAMQWVQGLRERSAEPGSEGRVAARLGLRIALRRVVRDRARVIMGLTSGASLSGRLSWVGADHVELEAADVSDRSDTSPITVPIPAIAYVRRR
jgi:hypothetical protein